MSRNFWDVSGGTEAQKLVSSRSMGLRLLMPWRQLGRDLESEGLSEETERGQAWETRVAGASFVFPSECVLVP